MTPITVSNNPFDLLLAFAFFCGPVGTLLFGNTIPPARQKELLVALGQGCLVIVLGLFVASGLDLPIGGNLSFLASPLRLLLATAPKIIGASLFILAGYFINKIFSNGGVSTALGMHLGLVGASVFMLVNFSQP
jgi:hypothetical protein